MTNLEEINKDLMDRIEHYNPVTITATESVGTMALALITLILLFALMKSQGSVRELQKQQGQTATEPAEGNE
jgi:hypothetical protein